MKRIPYGISDFETLQAGQYYFIDKTGFIPVIETSPRYLFFIRPRRFGKSLWLSVLRNYYDVNKKKQFAEIFKDTYIVKHPTEERNSYLILNFDFSQVNPDIRLVEQSFETYVKSTVADFIDKYKQLLGSDLLKKINSLPTAKDQLRELLQQSAIKNLQIYLIIDEYDNFANTILTTAGKKSYHDLTHGEGFYRFFFNLVKGATTMGNAGISKIFLTGVSPITMDDVTSGFNIAANVSLDAKYNQLLGFTETEVKVILDYYKQQGALQLPVKYCLRILSIWANNYKFAPRATTGMFNTDMVLYFILNVLNKNHLPDDLIDDNIKIDYHKLRHLILMDRKFNGNFSQLKSIIETGQVESKIRKSFPLQDLIKRENFISLLFNFGLLSISGFAKGLSVLTIPNQTVRHLMYGYLRDAYEDVDIFRIDFWKLGNLIKDMAYDGQWQPVIDFITAEIKKQTSVRDYLDGEKAIQAFLLAYVNITDYFLTRTEAEANQGYADFYLQPFLAKFPDMKFGYLIELKYIPRKQFSQKILQEKIKEAKQQLAEYAQAEYVQKTLQLTAKSQPVNLKKLVLVYKGWELVHQGEV